MAEERKPKKERRMVLVSLNDVRSLKATIRALVEGIVSCNRLFDELLTAKAERLKRVARRKAARDREGKVVKPPPSGPPINWCEVTDEWCPVHGCFCWKCENERRFANNWESLDKKPEINTLDKNGSSSPNEKDSSGEKTAGLGMTVDELLALDKKESAIEQYLREGEEAALANGMCLTTHEWPPTEECECPNCKKYIAERASGTIVDWTLRRP